MAFDFDDSGNLVSGFNFDDSGNPVAAKPVAKNGSLAGDTATALNIGTTVDIPQQVQGLNAFAKNASPLSRVTEAVLPDFVKNWRDGIEEAVRSKLNSRHDTLSAEYTDATQASTKKQFFTDEASWKNLSADGITALPGKVVDLIGSGQFFGDGWRDPRKIFISAVESAPSTLATMGPVASGSRVVAVQTFDKVLAESMAAGLGRDAAKEAAELAATKAAERFAMVAGGATEGAQGAGQAYEQTRQHVLSMPLNELMADENFKKVYAMTDPSLPEEKRQQVARVKAAEGAAMVSAAGAGLFDAVFGALGDRYLGSAAAGNKGVFKTGLAGVAQETPTEFIQSGGEKFSENLGIQQYAKAGQDLMAGVGEEAVAGGLSGGLMGGLMGGGVRALSGPQAATPVPTATPDPAITQATTFDDAIAAANQSISTSSADLQSLQAGIADIDQSQAENPMDRVAEITPNTVSAESIISDPTQIPQNDEHLSAWLGNTSSDELVAHVATTDEATVRRLMSGLSDRAQESVLNDAGQRMAATSDETVARLAEQGSWLAQFEQQRRVQSAVTDAAFDKAERQKDWESSQIVEQARDQNLEQSQQMAPIDTAPPAMQTAFDGAQQGLSPLEQQRQAATQQRQMTQQTRDANRTVAQQLADNEAGHFSLARAMPPQDASQHQVLADDQLPQPQRQNGAFIKVMARLLGKKVQWVSGASWDGMVKDANTIYLNADDNKISKLAVFGHEFWHQVKMTHPEVWAGVRQAIEPLFDDATKVRMFRDYNSLVPDLAQLTDEQILEHLNDPKNHEHLLEEFISDMGGNRFHEETFWTDAFAKMEAKEGHLKAVTLVRKFAKSMIDAINKLLAVLKMQGTSHKFATDNAITAEKLEQVRAALSDGLATYLNDTRYGNKEAVAQGEVTGEQESAKREDFTDQTLPTRWPTSKKLTPSVHDEMITDLDTLKQDAKQYEKAVGALLEEPGMHSEGMAEGTTDQKAEHVIERMRSNLLWLYDQVPEAIRQRSKLWYDGARKIAEAWAERYEISNSQAAGMLAVLSPQKDWFMNVTMAERILDILHTRMDHKFDKKMDASAFGFLTKESLKDDPDSQKNLRAYELAKGRTLAQVLHTHNLREAGIWIRAYDEAYHDSRHAIVTPEGGFVEDKTTVKGEPTDRAWGDFTTIGKAASIYVDGTPENINARLGGEHKVRNFYNNIFAPKDPRFTTIDTHAVAADLLRPLAGADKPVAENFGKTGSTNTTGLAGTYALHYEAYRRAAEDRGVLPREMQSITWEAVRGLFTEGYKGKKDNVKAIDALWQRVDNGELTIEQARDEIVEHAGGIEHPDWWNEGNTGYEAVLRDKSYLPERRDFGGAKMTFEVAPDPRNTELKGRWDALAPEDKAEISHKVAWKIVAKALASFGDENMKGELHQQTGGWLDDTNPSLSIWFNKRAAASKINELTRIVGYALNQMGMMRTSQKPFKNAAGETVKPSGVIYIKLPSGTDVSSTYMQIRGIVDEKGKPYVFGHSSTAGQMAIIHTDEKRISTPDLAKKISEVLGDEYAVGDNRIYADFPEKGRDSYGLRGKNGAGPGSSLRARSDQLRAEADALIEQLVSERGAKRSNKRSDAARDERSGAVDARAGEEVRGYGKASPGAVSVQGVHYSGTQRTHLDGRYYGTGAAGREAQRVKNAADTRLKERVYFYVDAGKGVTPEQGVGSIAHTARLDNVYDANADTFLQARVDRSLSGNDWLNAFESAVLDNGFDGYVSDFGTQRAAVLLGRHAVPVDALSKPTARTSPIDGRKDLPMGKMTGAEWKKLVPEAKVEDDQSYYKDQLKFSPSRTQTESPEFKEWFGDGNLLNEDGSPMVLYHGTNRDIRVFKSSKTGVTGAGVYLGIDPGTAEGYAQGAGANVMPVYARGRYIGLTEWSKYVREEGSWPKARAKAEADGVAGIMDLMMENAVNVFDPANIKSAIGNNGDFDGSNPDIRLSQRRAQVEQEAYDLINADPDKLVEEYFTRFGKVIDPDNVKQMFPAFVADPSLAAAVHEPSSYLSKLIYARALEENDGRPVIFTAGGGGSGKSEAMPIALRGAGLIGAGSDPLIFDSTLSSFKSAVSRIDAALATGAPVRILYTNRPVDKAFDFAMNRSRVVPASVLAHAHVGASNTIRQLQAHYANDADVQIVVVNNLTDSLDDMVVGDISDVFEYDGDVTERSLYDQAKAALDSGRITQDRYAALVAGSDQAVAGGVQEGQQGQDPGRPGEGLAFSFRRALAGQFPEKNFVVPETEAYLADTALLDLAYFEGKPIRLQVGKHDETSSTGYGLMHVLRNAAKESSRAFEKLTDDDAENAALGLAKILGAKETLRGHVEEGGKYVLRAPLSNKAVVLRDAGEFWTVQTVLPSGKNKWGVEDWSGRLTFPTLANPGAATSEVGRNSGIGQALSPKGREVVSTQLNVSTANGRPQLQVREVPVTTKKRRTIEKESPRRNIYNQPVQNSWVADAPSKMDDVVYALQDKHIDTRRVLEKIRAAGKQINDAWNPYLKEELYHGRSAKGVKDFMDFELRPLLTDMQARGVTMPELETYLHNRHAEERNDQIARVNPGMADEGSGIGTAAARAYLANLDPAKKTRLDALAKRVDIITSSTLDLLEQSGLEKPGTIAAMRATYQHYVPLQRDMSGEGLMGMGTGQGYSVRGPASKRAMGSKMDVVDILANIAMQRERAITRVEKNRVGQALYGLAIQNPNDAFWLPVDPGNLPANTVQTLVGLGLNPIDAEGVVREPVQRYINPQTGLVAERINPSLRGADNVLALRINGEDKYVFFSETDDRAQRMVHALKNLDADQLGQVMGMAAKATRYFAAINTQWNPIFGIINLLRDSQSMVLNLSTTPIAGHKAAVVKNTVSALRGIYIDLRDHRKGLVPSSQWANLWEEFQNAGGQTGYKDMFARAEDRSKALEAEFKKITEGKLKHAGRAIFDWLSDYNETMENATRLAAYKVAKDQGMSTEQAASLAKNLTVNFNRKGQVATQAGALYAFFNANVQGTTRLLETLKGPAGKKIVAGGLLLGTMQAMLLAMAGYDEEEPPSFVRERNLIMPLPGGKYATFPMPLGFHLLPNLGRIPTEFVLGGFKNPTKHIAAMINMFADTFNPIGNAGLSMQTIAPTVLDPLAALAENKDWTGKSIAKADRSSLHPTPGYLRAKDTASEFSKALTYGLNILSGGTKYKQGLISPTPDQIDYLIGQAAGGVGREYLKAEQVVTSGVTGEELPLYKIPLVGRFVGDTKGQASESGKFYSAITRINEHEAEIKGLRHEGKAAEAAQYLKDNPEARLTTFADRTEQQLTKLRKQKRELLKRDAPSERVKLVEQRITSVMRRFNQRVAGSEQPAVEVEE